MYQKIIVFFLFYISIILTSQASPLTHPSTLELKDKISNSLLKRESDIRSVDDVQKSFYLLPRSELTNHELQEMKYMMQHWRFRMSNNIYSSLKRSVDEVEQIALLHSLRKLDLFLNKKRLQYIKEALLDSPKLVDAYTALVQDQGDYEITKQLIKKDELEPFDGPRKKLNIIPLEPSSWTYEKWSEDEEFSRYATDSLGRIYYRGHFFEPGDIVVVNQNVDIEGSFSVLTSGPAHLTHSGIYVEMIRAGKRYPAIAEVHRIGIRLVPLHIYLSPDFINYGEIYKVKESEGAPWKLKVKAVMQKLTSSPHGYNFYADVQYSQNDKYLTCTQLVKLTIQRAGLSSYAPPECPITPTVQDVLKKVGLTYTSSALTPTSFTKDPMVELAGAFDSGTYLLNLKKETVLYRFNDKINKFGFNIDGFQQQLFYRVIKYNLDGKLPIIGNLLTKIIGGFNDNNLPIGPSKLMALILPLDKKVSKAFKQVELYISPTIENYFKKNHPFSFYDYYNSSKIQTLLNKHLTSFDAIFPNNIN